VVNPITSAELLELVHATGNRFVSLYLPTFPAGAQSQQNPIRFKNLLRVAEQDLIENGMNSPDARCLLTPAGELFDRPEFWRTLERGLAVLVGRDGMRVWHAPFEFQEQSVAGKRFHITPLIEWATGDSPYYVLAVSQNRVRLLHGTRDALEEVAVPELPSNLSQALGYDEPEGSFQVHTGRPQIPGKEGAVFYGQGGAPDAAKNEITSFFREIDRALAGLSVVKTEPLVFAGVDYLFPIFRRITSHPQLLPKHISGNPDLLSLDALRQRAWSLVRSSIDNHRESRVARYWDLATHGRTSNHVADIVVAAHAGAVETLFLNPTVPRLGAFAPQTSEVRIDQEPRQDREDLVNLAATLVLQRGGIVEAMTTGHVPGGGVMAALMRYPFASPRVAAAGDKHVNAPI